MNIFGLSKKLFYLSLLCIASLLFCSCATTKKPKMDLASIPLAEEKLPMNCAIITKNSVGASNVKILEWEIFSDEVPRMDLSGYIFGNVQHILNGLCSETIKIEDPDFYIESKIDFLVQPKVLDAIAQCDGITMFNNCSFSIDLTLFILDRNKIPILEFNHIGHANSKMGSSLACVEIAEQRSLDAIADCFTGISKKINSEENVKFISNNKEFFNSDDTTKTRNIEKLLSDRNNKNISSLLLSYASELKETKLLKIILELGIFPDIAYGAENLFPIHRAVYNNNIEMINLLITHGANLERENSNGRTALYYAAWNNFEEVTKILLENNVEYRNIHEDSNLFLSAQIYEKFGINFLLFKKNEDALFCFKTAQSFYKKAEIYFNDMYNKAKTDIFWASFKEAMLPAISQYVAGLQAKQQAKSMAEISALKNRGKGVGYGSASYITYIDIDKTNFYETRDKAKKYRIECKTKIDLLDRNIKTLASDSD